MSRGIRRYLTERRAFRGVRRDAGVVIYGDPRNLQIAPGVLIQAHVVLHAGGLEWCDYAGRIEIGAESVISPNSVLIGAGPGGIAIGRRFDCGPLVGIFASRTDYRRHGHFFAPVRIGDDVVVFGGAVVSPGVTIGDGAVVAANAVVTRDVAPATIVGGQPARPIGHR